MHGYDTGRRPPMGPLALFLVAALAASSPFAPVGDVQEAVLENGLTVLLVEERSTPLVSVAVMYKVGARNEAAGTTGLAHYAEHMNFRATQRFPGTEITEAITRIGGRWNGYTWIDQTYYVETVPREALDRMLELEADRMSAALYDPEDFEKERTSVIAELHSYDDPRSVLYDAVLAASFEIHPYRNNTIGWLSDVEGVSRDEAYRFYRRFYHPNNAVLVIVGDHEVRETLAKVRHWFGRLPAAGEPTEIRTVEPPQTGQRRVSIRRPGANAEVLLAFRAPALGEPDFPAMVLFDALLAGGKGFRFTREYPVPPGTPLEAVAAGLATSVRSDWQASRYPYVYTLGATAPREADLAATERGLFDAVDRAAGRDWTEDNVAAALRQIATGWAVDLDDKPGRAHQLAFFEVSGGWRHLTAMPDRLAGVTREDLRRFARERLRPDLATVGWFVPTDPRPVAMAPAPSPAPEKSAAVERTAARPRVAPAETRTLANGVRVILQPSTAASLVALKGRIDAGSAHGPGSAVLVERLARPAQADPASAPPVTWTLHEEPVDAVHHRWIAFEAACLPADVEPLLEVIARRIEAAWEAAEAEWADALRRAGDRSRRVGAGAAATLWQRALAALFPPASPLASPAWMVDAGGAAPTPKELARFARAYAAPSRLLLVLAGAVPEDAPAAVDRTVGRLRAPAAEASAPSAGRPLGPRAWREIVIARPEKAQNDLLVVWPGDRVRPHDLAATEVLLYLLGETGYAGRLGHALVDPGLVYSVRASLQEDGAPGFLMIRTAAAPKDTREVLARIRRILEDAARGRFAAAELAEAQAYLRGKEARAQDGSAAAAADAVARALRPRGVPPRGLTLEQLNDTARRLFASGAPVALVSGPGHPGH